MIQMPQVWSAAALWEEDRNAPFAFSENSGSERYKSGTAQVRRNGFMGQIFWWDDKSMRARTNYARCETRFAMLNALATDGDTSYTMLINNYCTASAGDAGVQGSTALVSQSLSL